MAATQLCQPRTGVVAAANVSGAGIYMSPSYGGSGKITIGLWSDLPNQAGAQQLATGSVFASSTQGWADVFWSATSVTPDQTYYLVFTSDNSNMGITGDVTGAYTRGNLYANQGYNEFQGWSYTFRTYQDESVTATPEPASLVLLGTGLLGIGGVVVKRRRTNA